MATYNKINAFVENLAEKVHNLGSDAITIFLTTNAEAPVASDGVLADITPISYTNLSARVPTIASSAQSGGLYKLILTDHVLTASGAVATFRMVGHYNDTPTSPADPLIQWYDHGSDVTLANGETYTIDYDGTNGFLNLQ